MASPPTPTRCQVFQQPRTLHTPLLTNFATTTTNNNLSTSIRPGKLPVTLLLSATNPSHELTNGSPVKHTSNNHLDFDDRTTRFQIKRLVRKITDLSSSNTKTEMLQILEKDVQFSQTISDLNHLLMALAIAQEHDLCLTLFAKLPTFQLVPDGCTHSIMIRCHCEKNDPDEAKRVLHTLLENGFQPDDATVTILMGSLCKKGKVKKAKEVFELLGKRGCKMNVQAYNCLLMGLCYVGRVEEALELLAGMKGSPLLNPDVYSYTVVMDGLCKVGLSDEAMGLLNEAVGKGIVPNVVTFNTLIEGYSREGRPMEGVAVLELMKKKHGCVPGYVNYSTVLHGLLKWNEIQQALMVYKEMVELGFEVDLRMMGKLVRRLCRLSRRERGLLQDACEVFEKMKERGSMVDQSTLEVMVQALCWEEKFDEALEHLHDMVKLGYSPGAIIFDKVIQGLCAKGRVEEAVSTLLLWLANGGVPHRISYDMLIKELNAQGRLFCASNLFGAALKQGIVLNREPVLCTCHEEGWNASCSRGVT